MCVSFLSYKSNKYDKKTHFRSLRFQTAYNPKGEGKFSGKTFQVKRQAGFPHSGCPSVLRSSALLVFVHPRTVDIDCVGDRLRHISTPLAPATEKHINWLHREPCLVTMAKHTGREEECCDGAAGSPCSLSGVVSHSFPVLQPRLSHTQLASSLLRSALFTQINTICIFLFLTHSSY